MLRSLAFNLNNGTFFKRKRLTTKTIVEIFTIDVFCLPSNDVFCFSFSVHEHHYVWKINNRNSCYK